ncbi:peptidase M24 [Burkholderia lata]|uniref:M24 family metallopeptidase n=1 Tax=Burkholderia lata (strain ATCC 17760 / DSM 23089 / LMG 22485 / NCIMB 9086 / R18194 / 383) TaxID=482957 RepID=UPI000841483B|nr:Xaa-Pro peptidase family protein [Burkholderia lata]AOJ43527.1 peptidase M24 [Burkholderia lata]
MTTSLPFPIGEFDARVERTQASLRKAEMDALVLTAPANFRYFTGLDSQFWESPTRPWFLIVPAAGPTIAIVPSIAEVVVQRCVAGSVMTWSSPRPDDEGVSLLSSVLNDLPRRFGKIGFELGRECALRMPVLDFLRLRDLLKSEAVDGSPCIWEVRNIKSRAEIEKIREAGQIVSRSFAGVVDFAKSGTTEAQLARDLTINILRGGAHTVPYMACASGPGGYDQIIARGSERQLRDGDVLIIDVGATVDGYFCDFDRNYAVGKIPDDARRAHDAVWVATEVGISTARAGTKVRDLWRAMMNVLEAAGMRGNNVGRLGHGLGLQVTEPPSNSAADEAVLEPGMVITIEPGMEYAPGKMIVHEENIAIAEDGFAEVLTVRAPKEMWTID